MWKDDLQEQIGSDEEPKRRWEKSGLMWQKSGLIRDKSCLRWNTRLSLTGIREGCDGINRS